MVTRFTIKIISEKLRKYSLDVKKNVKHCLKIYKTLNNLNPIFIKDIFKQRFSIKPVRK